MSTLKVNNVQVGQSNTATQNFTLTAAAADGTMKLARGNQGATTQDVLTVDASGNLGSIDNSGLERMVLRTAVATTSGTAVDFTGIPSWAKKITVMLNGVSTNGTALVVLQLGTSGGVLTSGYAGAVAAAANGAATYAANFTSSFTVSGNTGAADIRHGSLSLSLVGGNTWVVSGVVAVSNGTNASLVGGSISLGSVLDRVRLTTANGTDVFDAGSVNILIEG